MTFRAEQNASTGELLDTDGGRAMPIHADGGSR